MIGFMTRGSAALIHNITGVLLPLSQASERQLEIPA
jgi:hypothetical protein